MYKKVAGDLNFEQREKEVLDFWKKNDVFKKSQEQNSKQDRSFTFFDGPPTANGRPHIGHISTRVIKDVVTRYKSMKGYNVLRKAGWDTHGLPVELEVEKTLGISGKPDIEKYGIEPFIKMCKESVWKYQSEWEQMTDRVGHWIDMESPYITYEDNYIESEWWALKQIWEKGLLYQGYKIVPYCPRCGTALSSHEVAQGYKDVKEKSVIAKFQIKGKEKEYILAWTTTPWTLPSNVALAVHPEYTYVNVQVGDEKYILAEALIESVLGDKEYKVLDKFAGQKLVNTEYVPLYDFAESDKKMHYVVSADFVTLTDGTGIVHIAPAFGEDDANVGRKYDLPFIQLVDGQGNMKPEVTPWKGMFVKKVDPLVIEDLKTRGLLYAALDYEHSYPFCWRCDTPLIYYARTTWFIEMTKVRDNLIKNNNQINWMPESIGKGRFGDWLENVVDWGISRERYWGTPLPIWECECGHRHIIGSRKELEEMGTDVPHDLELHKPYIDKIEIACPECGKKMKRVPEVLDCWFDSGSMPFAQWHYPFENKDVFENHFPADFITEAVDQTRGWFYTLVAISTLLFNKPPFKNVIVLGHVQDKDGQKMSKHKGNVINPWDVLNNQGADAVRWYFYSNSSPWLPSRFYGEAVSEVERKFMGTLWNTYAFYVLYADIDNFDPTKYTLDYEKLSVMDKWILSKLNTLIKEVGDNLENYRITECSRILENFVDELSNWYVRRCRERFWAKGMEQDKINAYMTLYTVLLDLCRTLAPFMPYITEEIYQNITRTFDKNAEISIHLTKYPEANEKYIDKELEKNMDEVLDVTTLGRACRNGANMKNRQPLSKVYIKSSYEVPEMFRDVIKEELNIKEVEYVEKVDEFVTYKFKPQLKTVGPKYGKFIGGISKALSELNGNEAMARLNKMGELEFDVDGTNIVLEREDLLIETVNADGYFAQSDNGITVVIDTKLTEELIEEGFVREIVSKVQTMRKEAGFEVMDKITLAVYDNDKLQKVVKNNANSIMTDVLAETIKNESIDGYKKNWNINGESLTLEVKKN